MKEVFVDYAERHFPETMIDIWNPSKKKPVETIVFMKKLMIDLWKISCISNGRKKYFRKIHEVLS